MARTDRFPLTGGTVHSRPERASRVPRQEILSQTQPDLFDYEPPILKTHLLPAEAPLLVVTTRVFAEAERPDGWLYTLLPAEQGWRLIDNGLKLDAREPLVFCERPALLPLLRPRPMNTTKETCFFCAYARLILLPGLITTLIRVHSWAHPVICSRDRHRSAETDPQSIIPY